MTILRSFLTVSGLVLALQCVAPAQPSRPLPEATIATLKQAVATSAPAAEAPLIWKSCVGRLGTIEPVVAWLRKHADEGPKSQKDGTLRLLARLLRRYGELADAFSALDRIAEGVRTIEDDLGRAELLDALGRTSPAIEAYEALLKRDLPPQLSRRLTLRTALMKPVIRGAAKSPLAAAAESWDSKLKNQAAVVLALQNRHQEAIQLFEPSGEGTARFKEEVRLAEWSIEAEEWRAAKDHAWNATKFAKMKRDRRYALAVLVEAYRRANDLDGLLQHFATTEQLDDESRLVWIDLLRETGKVDEALRLFRDSATGEGFTNDMRRQLLELCRETGRERTLVEAYERLITEQPKVIEWREGLSRYHLEQGNRAAAVTVWKSHLDLVTQDRPRMSAAASLMKLGIDDLADEVARSVIGGSGSATNAAYLFLFELYSDRGREDDARKALSDLEATADPGAPIRLDIADAYARMGDKANAARMLQALKDARGDRSGTDSDVKLAILYSEIGEEEKAQALWYELWGRVTSVPRRKFVEERLMTVAARLGTLAKIAVDLESKLSEGTASAREAGMLVSLYTRVNDAVSATEIVEEHLKQSGAKSIDILVEKARLYLSCHDYHNYAEMLRKLIEIDPEGRPDHLRELAMNLLERGQRREARDVLTSLKDEPSDTTSTEFEAGVLSLAGLHELALEAYYRSTASSPDRIDGYLLLSNTLVTLGYRDRAAGMFQNLVADADKDDLFTISVDGILNLFGPRRRPGPDPLLAWTRRVALERVASRPDKPYLYQLVADVSDEFGDQGMSLRALQAALPIAGEQRSSLLRELMERTAPSASNRRVIVGPAGRTKQAGPKPSEQHLMFGRRLLGQGDLVPPDVYLKLGTAFLQGKEVVNASRTFNAASRLPEFDELQRKIAGSFENAGFAKEALRVYERVLTVESRSIDLIAKVGELHERLGRDDLAVALFERGIDLYVGSKSFQQTLEEGQRELSPLERLYSRQSNQTIEDVTYPRLVNGLIATLKDEDAAETLMKRLAADMAIDLARVRNEGAGQLRVGRFPKVAARAAIMRRLAGSFGRIGSIDDIDRGLLAAFPEDPALLDEVIRFRLDWGFRKSAVTLLQASLLPAEVKARHALRLGMADQASSAGLLRVSQLSPLVLPLLVDDKRGELRGLLERLDLSAGTANDLDHLPGLVSAALVVGDSDLCLALLRFWVDTAFTQRDAAKLNTAFTTLMAQAQEIRILTQAQRQSLVGRMIDRIASDPDRFSTLVRRLYSMIDLSEGALEAEQAEALIRAGLSAVDQLSFGIPELFAIIPADQRDQVFRRVWSFVARTQRSYFIANYVRLYDIEAPTMRAFLLDEYTKGLREADSLPAVGAVTRRLPRELRLKNLDLVMSILDALEKRDSGTKISFASVSSNLASRKDSEGALTAVQAMWKRFANTPQGDRRSLERLVLAYAPEHPSPMGELVASVTDAKKRAALERTLKRVASTKAPSKSTAGDLEELRKRVTENPENEANRSALLAALQRGAYWFEAVDVARELFERTGSSKHKKALIAAWRLLRNPIKALAVDPERTKGKRPVPNEARNKARNLASRIMGARMISATPMTTVIGPRNGDGLPPVSDAQVRAELRKKDPSAGRALYRASWRQNQGARIFRSFSTSRPATTPRRVAAPTGRSRGGFPAFRNAPASFLSAKPAEWKPTAPDRNKLPYLLAKAPFGLDELSRHLRSTKPSDLATPEMEDVLRAVGDAAMAKAGAAAIQPILARHREGNASAHDYALLFVLLQASEENLENISVDTLDAVLQNIGDDLVLMRRLAGLYARFGFPARASALFSWCAASTGPMDQFGRVVSPLNPDDLLGEVLSRLEGRHRTQAVATILRATRFRAHDRHGLARFERSVLATLVALDGPQVALRQSSTLIDSLFDLSSPPRREAAMIAAGLLARAGEHDRALRLMDLALLPSAPPPTARPHERNLWTARRTLQEEDLRWLFPKDTAAFKDAGGWHMEAAAHLKTLHRNGDVEDKIAFPTLCQIAIRLAENGRAQDATRLVPDLEKLARDETDDALWIADVLRKALLEDEALAIERGLLDQGRLHPERIPGVITSIFDRDGAGTALAIGAPLLAYTLHPDLLDVLIRAARQQGDEAEALRFTDLRDRAHEALEELDRPAPKPRKKPKSAVPLRTGKSP